MIIHVRPKDGKRHKRLPRYEVSEKAPLNMQERQKYKTAKHDGVSDLIKLVLLFQP